MRTAEEQRTRMRLKEQEAEERLRSAVEDELELVEKHLDQCSGYSTAYFPHNPATINLVADRLVELGYRCVVESSRQCDGREPAYISIRWEHP